MIFGVIVRTTAEGIGFILVARFVMEFVVVLREFDLPSGCSWANFLWGSPIREVLMICLYDDG
jgi:hypothetical protein